MNIDKLVEECYNAIPPDWRQRPWDYLNHGRAVLDTENQLNAYIAAYGEMHIVKCRMAMQNFPFEQLVRSRGKFGDISLLYNFEVYDWGCGQGIGSLVLLQMLHERGMLHGLRRITLIEPSTAATSRAVMWIKQSANASTEVRIINRYIPSNETPMWDDVLCNAPIAIHICSNILDIKEVGLKWLALMTSHLAERSIYVCVGPQYGRGISRIGDFYNYLGQPKCFADFSKYPCAYTTKTRHPFSIEAKCFKFDSSKCFNADYVEQSTQVHLDEYQSGDECIKGILSDSVVSAYHDLLDAANRSSFELYLRPSIGIERPDFIMIHIDHGVVIINICEDVSKFKEAYERVEAIKHALIDTYIKSLKIGTIIMPSTYNVIKVGLYFPTATPERVQEECSRYYKKLLEPFEKISLQEELEQPEDSIMQQKKPKDPTLFMVKLYKGSCYKGIQYLSCRGFRHDFYNEIKNLILGTWHHYSQGDMTLQLTKRQKKFVNDDNTRLRIKGVAGCGKTQIVAHKAVREHIRTGTKVLIVTYNISLISYIKMRINQVPADFSTDAFEIINYHQFFMSKARRYFGTNIRIQDCDKVDFFKKHLDDIKANKDQYDTIIIDEAQDFITAWFDCLRMYFLTENGRLILCGDAEQNIYGRDNELTTKLPAVNGFQSRWENINERVSMRMLNPGLTNLSSKFSKKFGMSILPIVVQKNILEAEYSIGYWNISSTTSPINIASNIEWILEKYALNTKDVVILGQSINLLREVDYNLRTGFFRKTMTTFESKEEYDEVRLRTYSPARFEIDLKAIRRVAKVHFTTDVDILKLATIQSFKGWESKSVILIIQCERDDVESNEDEFVLQTRQNIPAHIYVGITRARENLFILNMGNQKYHDFFKNEIQND